MSSPPHRIRPGTPGDAAGIAAIHSRAWASMILAALPDYPVTDEEAGHWQQRWEKALLAPPTPRQGVAVLELGGQLVGAAWLGPFKNRGPGMARRALLRRLYVSPGHQGAGLGSALLSWAEARALEGGARQLELWCLDLNLGALGFYRARGYRPDGSEGVYRRDGRELRKRRYLKLIGEQARQGP